MTRDELLQRYAAGERDFRGVDLSGVDLYRANLWAAKTLVGTRGVYSAYAIGMSSRNDTLCGGVDDEFNLKIQAGCFSGTPDEFRAAVATTHGVDSSYAQRYMFALQFIEQCFALDADKWAEMKAKLEKGEES